jgi:hypothetical protein
VNFRGIDNSTLLDLARAMHNAALFEEYRARRCESRFDDVKDCECWMCEHYGLNRYWDYQLHQDIYPPKNSSSDGLCWVCEMSRRAK